MALILKGCVEEACGGFTYTDTTGTYSTTNLGGYGVANTITGPADFDTYTLTFWDPTKDPSTDAPTVVLNLLQNVPTADADGHYAWPEFVFGELNLPYITAGVGYFEAVGTKDGDEYRFDFIAVFTQEIYDKVKAKVKAMKFGGKCAADCTSAASLWEALMVVQCGGSCSKEQTNDIIAWLKAQLKKSCC